MQQFPIFNISCCGICQFFCFHGYKIHQIVHMKDISCCENSRPSVWKYSSTVAPFVLASSVTPASREVHFPGSDQQIRSVYHSCIPLPFPGSASYVHLLLKQLRRSDAYLRGSLSLYGLNTMGYCNHLSTAQYSLEGRLDMLDLKNCLYMGTFQGQSAGHDHSNITGT